MVQTTDNTIEQGGFDLWLAALMVFFLGLGAFATYALTAPEQAQAKVPLIADHEPFEGTSFDTPVRSETKTKPTKKNRPPGKTKVTASSAPADYEPVSFELLGGFFYEDPNAEPADEVLTIGPKIESNIIPSDVVALSGKSISVKGFMVPIKVEDGAVKTFLLVKNQMLCCYGQMPRMNDWIFIKMKEGTEADFFKDIEITVYGKLEVGEEKEKGIVLSIYRMEADRMEGPLDL